MTHGPTSMKSRFLRACTGANFGRPPVWIMRQAGRYLPEYQVIRKKHSFVEMCTQTELAVDVTLQPYRRFGFDAVVVFYDILFLPEVMGAPLQFTEAGPVFSSPLRERAQVEALHEPDLTAEGAGQGTGAILETIRAVRESVAEEDAVLGFAGAPFTLAAYLVEGNFQRSGERVRRMMHAEPQLLHDLLNRLTTATCDYVAKQVEAGADAVQLFDTWAGLLASTDYEQFALPYQQRVFDAINAAGVPSILYINGCSHLIDMVVRSRASGLSMDWREPLPSVRSRIGTEMVLQGNLAPLQLFKSTDEVRVATQSLLNSMAGDPSYVVNLGHGIHRETPVASVEAFVETVHDFDDA